MENKVTIGIRFVLMLVDHFAMTFIIMIVSLSTFGIAFLINSIEEDHWTVFLLLGVMVPLIFSIYLNKDAVNGQSPAKRILKFKVVDIKTNNIASPIKCLLRNLLYPFWIIEIPFVLINPERKLGDLIAGTKVVKCNSEIKTKPDFKKIITATLLGMIYMSIIFFIYFFIIAKVNGENFKEIIGI